MKDTEVKVLSTTFTKQPTETKFNGSRTSLNLNQDFHFQEKFSNSRYKYVKVHQGTSCILFHSGFIYAFRMKNVFIFQQL